MKRVCVLTSVLTVIVLAVPGAALAQGLTYGAKAGVTMGTLSFDPESGGDFGYRIGLAVGGFVALPLGSRLTIQPEGLFNQRGAKADDEGLETTIALDYIDVPVLVKYAVTHGGSRSFFVFGGPSAAFKVRSRATATFGDTTIDLDADEDIESFEFGVVAGGGVDFGKWSIDGRYSWGLSNLNKDDEDDVKLRSRAFSVLAGIRF
jgi:Outer membrane protein beta-barrel domain